MQSWQSLKLDACDMAITIHSLKCETWKTTAHVEARRSTEGPMTGSDWTQKPTLGCVALRPCKIPCHPRPFAHFLVNG